jgi:plasmid stabilization system protein ParE
VRRVLRPEVEPELRKDARWYEGRQAGLGAAFLEAVDEALRKIEDKPRLYPEVHLDIRRAPLKRFPYGVYYVLVAKEIHVLAVAHDRRHPSRWRRRR